MGWPAPHGSVRRPRPRSPAGPVTYLPVFDGGRQARFDAAI